jgi:hypothetical protein
LTGGDVVDEGEEADDAVEDDDEAADDLRFVPPPVLPVLC